MKLSTFLPIAALACAAPVSPADELDLFPPWWRNGHAFAVEVAWTWPAAPPSPGHMAPTFFSSIGENPPRGVLMDAPGWGGLNEFGWTWEFNGGRPGVRSLYNNNAGFIFPWWELGVGMQMPMLLRLQITYDGPSPTIQVAPGVSPPVMFTPDSHHVYYDQDVWGMTRNIVVLDIPAGSLLREVHIDTFAFPAPGAVALIGTAALAAMRRRR